jgi:hypothetical protein
MPHDRGQHETAGALKLGGQPPEPAAVVRQLHAMVREARVPLIDPTAGNLDDCRGCLDGVASALRKVLAGLQGGDPKQDVALAEPLASLRAEIGRVAMLLDSAAAFHMGWMHLAACMVSGYTADGTPATPELARRVSLEV